MKVRPWLRLAWGVGALLVTLGAGAAHAEEKPWSRAYRGELYPIIQVLGSDTTTGFGGALEMKTDTTPTFGAGMGINWNDHLNILKSRLTPLVTGGVGFIMLTDNGVSETDFSYNLGVGGRWDITASIALRVIYRSTWARLEDSDDPSRFGGVTANLIFMFQ
jgi:opacity protein-like surface antigen